MEFTYSAYFEQIESLKACGYSVVLYGEVCDGKQAILRHDVDFDLKKALEFAEKEATIANVASTYFVLPRSGFYNLFSAESVRILHDMEAMGHEIGLHFDEMSYSINENSNALSRAVQFEKAMLEQMLGHSIRVISMHRPSKFVLNNDLQFDGLINSYSQEYFNDWKYVSDSRMHWREDLGAVITCDCYDKLHILTHPFWYSQFPETTQDKLLQFMNHAKLERYENMYDNFLRLDEFVQREDAI